MSEIWVVETRAGKTWYPIVGTSADGPIVCRKGFVDSDTWKWLKKEGNYRIVKYVREEP